jgi:hypothetical protein
VGHGARQAGVGSKRSRGVRGVITELAFTVGTRAILGCEERSSNRERIALFLRNLILSGNISPAREIEARHRPRLILISNCAPLSILGGG